MTEREQYTLMKAKAEVARYHKAVNAQYELIKILKQEIIDLELENYSLKRLLKESEL